MREKSEATWFFRCSTSAVDNTPPEAAGIDGGPAAAAAVETEAVVAAAAAAAAAAAVALAWRSAAAASVAWRASSVSHLGPVALPPLHCAITCRLRLRTRQGVCTKYQGLRCSIQATVKHRFHLIG